MFSGRIPGKLVGTIVSAALAASIGAAGCASQEPSLADDDLTEVTEGKADNFFSTTASEYYVNGESKVVLEDSYLRRSATDKLARAKELMALKTIAIGWFLHVRLVDKTGGGGDHGDPNATTYPGFHAMVRNGEYVNSEPQAQPDGKTYSFKVRLQVAGQKKLIDVLPGTTVAGRKNFTLALGKPTNEEMANLEAEHEWFRSDQWSSGKFDPTKLPADQIEPLELAIYPQPASTDAYFDNKRLVEDGQLTIDVHYGWDYWNRYDIVNSQRMFDWLVSHGFHAAESYDQYEASFDQAGALTKTVSMNGKDVKVSVRLFHGLQLDVTIGPDPDTDEGGRKMEDNMYRSLAESDVIIFAGHSGNYYGFALANWKKTDRGAIDYPQILGAVMPADRYQVVLASGCDTFSIGQAFRENPAKAGLKNLDVITTTTFSNAGSNAELEALLDALYGHADARGNFNPMPVSKLLEEMNGSWGIGAMYGVHGVDDNPRLHPFARLESVGKRCTDANAATMCGGTGNHCTRGSSGTRVCSATCLEDAACPTGFKCKQVASGSTIVGRQCLK